MSEFQFDYTNYNSSEDFLIAAGERQTNVTPQGEEIALKTTHSQGPPKETLTVFSISDAAMNSALMKPEGAMADIYNRVGQDAIATGIADGGGVEAVLGAYTNIAPTDLILKANNIPPRDLTQGYGIAGGGPVQAVDPAMGGVISSQGWAMPQPLWQGPLSASADFGERPPPKTSGGRGSSYHRGLDLGGDTGDPIHASKGGTVTAAGVSGGAGKRVVIDHGGGYSSKYFHMSAIHVKVGDQVMANQIIGLVGATGNVSGAHLHFEIHKDGQAIDPAPLLGIS